MNGSIEADEADQTARRLLKNTPLIDGHNDFPYIVRGWHPESMNNYDISSLRAAHTDLQRLQQGGVGCQIWSAYVPSPACNKDNVFETAAHYESLLQTIQQIDVILCWMDRYSSSLGLATCAADILDIFLSGRIASLIGVEGLHQIANSASVLRTFHRLGVRYVTLTHSHNNLYADSATASCKIHEGLSQAGTEMVREMNRIGMMLDLSHTSDDVQRQVLRLSRAPVIYSHSSCFGLCPHVRNVGDDCLRLLQKNAGLIMISFVPSLTESETNAPATIDKVADHIVYAGSIIGYEHVGIGSDFDGVMQMVPGLDNVTRFPALVAELVKRKIPEASIQGILGLNFIRVLQAVEKVAKEIQQSSGQTILSDKVDPIFDDDLKKEMSRIRIGTT